MKYVEVNGVRLSAVGLGTWQFGSRDWAYGESYASKVAPDLVRRALDLGINLFDSAEAYAWGRSERILGAALSGRRSEAFVATKLLPILPVSPVVERRAQASADRLAVDAIDLYQVHWHNPLVPMASTMSAFSGLVRHGLVRHVGVSNFSLSHWIRAEEALGSPVLSNQVRFNLVDRRPERDLLAWAQARDRLIIAYSPLAQGLLSGAYHPGRQVRGIRSLSPGFLPENLHRIRPLLEVLHQVAQAHGCSDAQVALAWLLRRPNVVVIPGASSVQQLESNAAAAEITLTDEQDAALVAASEAFVPLGGVDLVSAMARVRLDRMGQRLRRVSEALDA